LYCLFPDNLLKGIEARFVIDGNIWTGAGVSAGIDLALAFIKHEAGEKATGKVQSLVEYYPAGKRYGKFHQDSKAPGYLQRSTL
jgi:transcriptional regulator GlxA family with amidase domain